MTDRISMRHDKDKSPVSFKASVMRLPQKGLPLVIEADDRQREALAQAHGLVSVEASDVSSSTSVP